MNDEGIFNAADEDQVRDSEQNAKNERDQEIEDLRDIMAMPQGMRFLRRLMEIGHVFSTSFTGNSKTYFNEGMRNMALMVFNDICEASPNRARDIMIKKEGEY